jgi:hypothetical protein
MNILFPTNLSSPRQVDSFWQNEAGAAGSVGFGVSILSESHFGSPMSIFNKQTPTLYRGWIVKPSVYQEMDSLGAELVNSYQDYMWSYNFPEWYVELKEYTPYSMIIPADDIANAGLPAISKKIAEEFNDKSILIKDYLKSRKHEWYDACFIRDASDQKESLRVMSNFFKLQGRDFYGGLVCRDFLSLKKIGLHPKSRMPLPVEFRTFFVKGTPVFTTPYWGNDAVYPENVEFPPMSWLIEIGKRIKSPFVALDIVQAEDDKWWVIEVNDGGSAGLPDHVNLEEFYSIIMKHL